MRKIFMLFAAITTGSCATMAQVQFSFGPGAGFNYAIHSSTASDEVLYHFGALATSQFDMQFSRHFGLLLWVDFFSDMSVSEKIDDWQNECRINYLHLAPTLKFCIPRSPFYLFAGPGIGVKTKGKMKTSYQGFSMEDDIPDMLTRYEARMGAGYDFFVARKVTLSPFAAFNVGLNEVFSEADWQINALQVGIILRFNMF